MNFDWKRYLVMVKKVAEDPAADEAHCRMAISRAYYAAFHTVRQMLEREPGVYFSPDGIHSEVFKNFKWKFPSEAYRYSNIWGWRRDADYKDDLSDQDLPSAVATCLKFSNDLVADIEMGTSPFPPKPRSSTSHKICVK